MRAIGLLLLSGVIVMRCCAAASAAEVCRFTGTTNHEGHVAVTATAEAADGMIQVDVVMAFDATTFWTRFRYLVEEISTWRGRDMQSVAVNTRYLVGDHIVRQQWDAFQRTRDGLQARRVQAKTLDDFRQRHPGFVQHWDPASFGSPWLQDYQAAPPERRADLDLKGAPLPEGLGSPLAMAFYWSRWLPDGAANAAIFLPGFKADKVADLQVAAADGGARQATVRHPALDKSPASTATVLRSADGHLLELSFDVHGPAGSAEGQLRQAGCNGAPVKPGGPA
jgi:hypothetical protein